MTSSGVATFNPTLIEILTVSARMANLIRDDQALPANMRTQGLSLLNLIAKEWQAKNIRVWTQEEAVLFLAPNQTRYLLGLGSTTAHCTDAFDYLQTTLASGAAAGASSIVLSAYSPLAAADAIGIELNSGAIQWTTVVSVAGVPTVTITAALTAAAAAGNRVFAYTNKIIRPLKISRAARIAWGTSPTETPLTLLARHDYMDRPNKSNTGQVNEVHYSPKLPEGEFFVYPTPADVDTGIRFTYQRSIFDFVANSDTADFPAEWQNAIHTALAYKMAASYQMKLDRLAQLKGDADEAFLVMYGWDRQNESVLMAPDMEG